MASYFLQLMKYLLADYVALCCYRHFNSLSLFKS